MIDAPCTLCGRASEGDDKAGRAWCRACWNACAAGASRFAEAYLSRSESNDPSSSQPAKAVGSHTKPVPFPKARMVIR